ncbi:MAG: hypothetical protein EXQ47_03240 [Bryobacterales bacterium]|nr:hypothetical protein [Bryobacterales bacterium]
MRFEADVLIEGPHHKQIAVIEVKNQLGLSVDHGRLRLAYMRLSGGPARCFMLASQDVAFIWRDGEEQPTVVSMEPVIRRYLPDLAAEERLYGFQVETLILHWLNELVAGWRTGTGEPESTLAAIGFLDAVRNGTVHSKAVA